MEELLALLERDHSQEWIVWGEENTKVFFIKAFPSQASAVNYRNLIERMGIAATVTQSSSPLRIQALQGPEETQLPQKIENLEEVAAVWQQVTRLFGFAERADVCMDLLEKHPDFLKVEEWISFVPISERDNVRKTVASFLKKPEEIKIDVCEGDSCPFSSKPHSSKPEPAKSEPSKSEPSKSEPSKSEPSKSEPAKRSSTTERTSRKEKEVEKKEKEDEKEEPVGSPTRRSRVSARSSRTRVPPRSSRTSGTVSDAASPEEKSPEKGRRQTYQEPEDEREKSTTSTRPNTTSRSRPSRVKRG